MISHTSVVLVEHCELKLISSRHFYQEGYLRRYDTLEFKVSVAKVIFLKTAKL